jgi:hypothetical protein
VNTTILATLISEISVIFAFIVPIIVRVKLIANGMKCQLRSDMLRIYYAHNETKVIRQYEYENFVMLYESYKALKGNSFIDKIYAEVQTWKVIT